MTPPAGLHPPSTRPPPAAAAARGVAGHIPGATAAAFPRLGFRAAAAAFGPVLSVGAAMDNDGQRSADGGGGAGALALGPFGLGWAPRSAIWYLLDSWALSAARGRM
jgi:hypothetical protein